MKKVWVVATFLLIITIGFVVYFKFQPSSGDKQQKSRGVLVKEVVEWKKFYM